jgi:hypothetical protein
MKKIVLIAVVAALLGNSEAQTALSGVNFSTHSYSGQFVVHAPGAGSDATLISRLTADPNYIQLDPSLLVVSCERIKQLLWRRLDDKPSWCGKIFLNLRPARTKEEFVTIVSEKFSDGWQYRVHLPDVMERGRFVRAIVQVLLVEIANRGGEARSTEIPLWLVEGLSRDLLASGEMEIILPPPNWKVNGVTISPQLVSGRRPNPLARARAVLGEHPPLTFDELSWPADDPLSGEVSEVYQSSAQLFVDRLLEFKDGPACLRAMIAELPRHLNWQLAFLNGFKPHFQRTLDVEKWWAVQVAQFTGRDLTQTWSPLESWNKLDEIIRASVQVRTSGDKLPLRTEVDLQTLLHESNGIELARFYRQKLDALDSLRLRVSQDLVGLVDEYRQALGAYLQRQSTTVPFMPLGKQGALVTNPAAQQLIHQLDALEVKRQAMRQVPQKPEMNTPENISAAFRE